MIQAIINKGKYIFEGNLDDLKKCLSSLKITKIKIGEIQGLTMCDCEAKFRYHGVNHKISINKLWNKDALVIEYRGSYIERGHENVRDKETATSKKNN